MIKGINTCVDKSRIASVSIKLLAWTIIISTQFIKQHVILDAVGAIYLGEIIFNVMPNIINTFVFLIKGSLSYTANQ